ncbi:cyanoexosortase C [Leptolyngbya sp. DQ-M1]|uniref:cyanoexosortase C n=1 Tax=Leptolyngbya sp. DQ-M1 TaxID=2933920 RepID=UPI003298ECAE
MPRDFSDFKSSLRSIHNWILLLGAALGLGVYFPTWLSLAATTQVSGMPHLILNVLLIGLAVRQLRRDQHHASLDQPLTEDQWLGSSLVLGGLAIFYFYYPATAPQAFGCMIMLIGGTLSYLGSSFLRHQWLAIALLTISLHPNWQRIARHLWSIFAPPKALAEFMAWGGSWVLRAIGQPVDLQNEFVILPAGSVEVAPGCDGFEMAFVIMIAAVIIGLAFRVRAIVMVRLIAIGITLALLLNIVRIAVMVLAAVYWGKAAFEFWHGSIGGQVFSGVLFTIYYYAIQPILNLKREGTG